MVLVEAGIQQPVAVGVTRQKVHGAVAGWGESLAPQHRIPLKTLRSTPSRGARAAAAGSDGPRGLRRACVVSACDVSARGPAGARARAPSEPPSAGDFPSPGKLVAGESRARS